MDGDGFTTTTKGGKKNAQQKQHKETVLVTTEQAKENKKKKKQQNMGFNIYGATNQDDGEEQKTQQQQDQQQEEKQPAKKHQKGGKKRKGKGNKDQEDEEEEKKDLVETLEEEKKGEAVEGEENKEEAEKKPYPIEIIYCKVCTMPPEYCTNDKKDASECKAWLKQTHPEFYAELYPEEAQLAEGQEQPTAEDAKEQKPQKKKKKVGFGQPDQEVKIYKAKRGSKKTICYVVGLQSYGVNLKDMSKLMSKKFACSSSVVQDEKYGECIILQGDIELRFEEFAEMEFAKYNIPMKKVKFEDTDKKKKKAALLAAQQEDDE